ncbi:hypothetical protein [Paenibacillus sp. SI8]|uniref:hypothetical protein n=1 Tax=unclassified Paenibacillus TaxID=185978 RepID=UPI003466C2C7
MIDSQCTQGLRSEHIVARLIGVVFGRIDLGTQLAVMGSINRKVIKKLYYPDLFTSLTPSTVTASSKQFAADL